MLSAFAIVCLLIWFALVLAWHGFWRMNQRLKTVGAKPDHWPSVTCVVPARNEAKTIAACLTSIATQDYPGELSVIVVNDSSTDRTADTARKTEPQFPESSFAVIDAPPLEAGWAGKMWALNHGVAHARCLNSEFFWFTDADIEHQSNVLSLLVGQTARKRLDLASVMVRLRCKSFWERLLVPPFVYFFFLLYPPRAVTDPANRIAGAAGGCMLVCRQALERAGGIRAIRSAIIDDCALAQVIKSSGGNIWLGLGDHSRSLRGYSKLSDLWTMVRRSAYHQLRYSPVLLVGVLAGLVVTFAGPVFIAVQAAQAGRMEVALAGCAAIVVMLGSYWPVVRYFRLPGWWVISLPIAALVYGAMTIASAARHYSGRGNTWRGQ